MSLLTWLLRFGKRVPMQRTPPPRQPDPDIVSGAMEATRALTKADSALQRRRRLNLELRHAEDVIRRAREQRTGT